MEKENIIYALISLIILLLIFAFIFSIPSTYDDSKFENNTVVRIIDGDTFEYYDGTSEEIVKVRLLCVDTPEKGEEGYEEAKNYLKFLILYKEVTLNSSITDKDKYNRLLRYVYVEDFGETLFVNRLILEKNYGELSIVPPETCEELK